VVQFECGTRILRVIFWAGRPCHSVKLHHYRSRLNFDLIVPTAT